MSTLPQTLYVATHRSTDVLKSERTYTNEERVLDNGMSNDRIYGFTDPDAAIRCELRWWIEYRWQVVGYEEEGDRIEVSLSALSPIMTQHSVIQHSVRLCTIHPATLDRWEPVTDVNGAWSTTQPIGRILQRRLISMYDWMVGKTLKIHHPRFR